MRGILIVIISPHHIETLSTVTVTEGLSHFQRTPLWLCCLFTLLQEFQYFLSGLLHHYLLTSSQFGLRHNLSFILLEKWDFWILKFYPAHIFCLTSGPRVMCCQRRHSMILSFSLWMVPAQWGARTTLYWLLIMDGVHLFLILYSWTPWW